MLSISALTLVVLGLYYRLCQGRKTHSVPRYLLPAKEFLIEPYECINEAGDLDVCARDDCNGSWKPPRAHHCSTCGVCRMEFDHHCPWLGNCVTMSRMRYFIALLCLTPVTFFVAFTPILTRLVSHITIALSISQKDPWSRYWWWDWVGSWVLVAGPFGRWVIGALLGFRLLRTTRKPAHFPGHVVEIPHMRVMLIVTSAFVLTVFAITMAVVSTSDIFRGQTTLDTLRIFRSRSTYKKRFVCIPDQRRTQLASADAIFPVGPHERLYDLGPRENWKFILSQRFGSDDEYIWPKLNPNTLRRLRRTR